MRGTRSESVTLACDSVSSAWRSRGVPRDGDWGLCCNGVLHSGFNGGPNIASAVNLACTGWLSYASEHAANWHTKLTIRIPLERLLVLAAQKLADGEWWCRNAQTYEA